MMLRLIRSILFGLLVIGCSHPAPAPKAAATAAAPADAAVTPAAPQLVAIEAYGSRLMTTEALMAVMGDELRAFGEAAMNGGGDRDTLVAHLHALGDYAYVEPSLIGYFEPGGMKYYLTVDFVDRADAGRRMPFGTGQGVPHPDPDGLIATWQAYEQKVLELMTAGTLSPQRVDCPAFHCLGDPSHPALADMARKFAADVPAHADELEVILREDADETHRAAAAFLLAYEHDAGHVGELMIRSFRDPSPLVRNNAMRVIADMAFHHPEIGVPVEPAMVALMYPSTTDRNKASAILAALMARPDSARWHRAVATRVGGELLAMLRLQQPNNHDFAYQILKSISGESFGERDYDAWQAWVQRQQGTLERP